jgi:hypothetical protein
VSLSLGVEAQYALMSTTSQKSGWTSRSWRNASDSPRRPGGRSQHRDSSRVGTNAPPQVFRSIYGASLERRARQRCRSTRVLGLPWESTPLVQSR